MLDEMASLPPLTGLTLTGDYSLAAVPARYCMELGKWQEASELRVQTGLGSVGTGDNWMAVGVGSARSGNLKRAVEAEQTLAGLRDATSQAGQHLLGKPD